MTTKKKNIMLAFVSPLRKQGISETFYPDIQGRSYTGIQTNEAAIVYVQRLLAEHPLDKVYLIASNEVRNKKAPEPNEFGSVTNLEFLEKRLVKEDARFADTFAVIPYDGDSMEMDDNLRAISRMAKDISTFVKENSDAEITAYADMTGGFRYGSMMMLAILQMLRYEGVQLGQVLYTDFNKKKVFNATSLQQVTQLINGANEFVRYGSVDSLNEYFENVEKTPALQKLLDAMQRFSDAIHICRTGVIREELQGLNLLISDFREHHGEDLQEELFANIIEIIEREYGKLITGHATNLDIIRWCVQKGFLQQAMTLCTEWLPVELIKRNIAYTDDPFVMMDCNEEGEKVGRSWQVFFIATYNTSVGVYTYKPRNEKKVSSTLNQHASILRAEYLSVLEGTKDIDDTPCRNYPKMAEFYQETQTVSYDLTLLKIGFLTFDKFRKKFPLTAQAIDILYEPNRRNPNYRKTFSDFLWTINPGNLRRTVLAEQNFVDFFQVYPKEKETQETNTVSDIVDEKWKQTAYRYKKLYNGGVLKTVYGYNNMLACLHDYFEIRTERNQINHANSQATTSIKEIEKLLLNSLDRIEQIKRV